MLPASLLVLERGWLSSNNVVCFEGEQAALIDRGYVTHAAQTVADGEQVELGGLNWCAIAVPGHDMDALAFYNAERRLLISGDALWRDGFGVIFSELIGHTDDAGGLKAARETLDRLPACRSAWSFLAMAPLR